MNEAAAAAAVPDPPFSMGEYHKKALVNLLHCYYNNRQTLSYPELSRRIDVGEKTKAWQCGAYRELKNHDYIVSSAKGRWELSDDRGVPLARTLVSDEELAQYVVPDTTAKLHEQIKRRLQKITRGGKGAARLGERILDLMSSEDYVPVNKHDMAAAFNTLADSHGFFYALQALKNWGYVEYCDDGEIAELKRRHPDVVVAAGKKDGEEKKEDVAAVKEEKEEAIAVKEEKDGAVAVKEEGVNIKTESVSEMPKKHKVRDDEEEPPKKKRKCIKKRSGGKPLKLSKMARVD